MYIVKEYRGEMQGTKIPDDLVVRAANGGGLQTRKYKTSDGRAHHVVQRMVFVSFATGVDPYIFGMPKVQK
jgi:signal transduction histidine kinase